MLGWVELCPPRKLLCFFYLPRTLYGESSLLGHCQEFDYLNFSRAWCLVNCFLKGGLTIELGCAPDLIWGIRLVLNLD